MPSPCSICGHPRRQEIDAALASGTSLRAVAREFSTTHTALSRHRAHIGSAPAAPSAPGAPSRPEADQAPAPLPARRRPGPRCTVCSHAQRSNIDTALVAGATTYEVAAQNGLSQRAVARHAAAHIPAALAVAAQAQVVASAGSLLDQIQALQAEAAALLERAKSAGDIRAAAAVLAQQGRFIELLGKVQGELQDGPTVNIAVSPDWQHIRTAIMVALQPFADARIAVANALALEHQP
jgi:hypothetical protein